MKLGYRITLHLSIALSVLMFVWASIFYFVIIDEINDETEDALEDYSETIITRALAGESLPANNSGSNNSFHIKEVTPGYARQNDGVTYSEEMIYIESKGETEPAHILKTIFRDSEDRFYELTVSIPTIEKKDLQLTILQWTIILYVILLIVIIIVNMWIFRQSFRPLYKLLNWLDNFNVGKKSEILVNDTKVIEFQKLNDAVIRSAQRNIEMYEQQKNFIGNASHELQTPLAICRNRLEMLAEDPHLTEKQLEEIFKIQGAIDRIIRLNKTLLLLTKIENRQFPEKKEININKLVEDLSEDYSEVYSHRNIKMSTEESGTLLFVMNEELASVLISNLLKNSYIHNFNNGIINISIDSSSIKFSNSGSGNSLDVNKIYKRFYCNAKNGNSSGLGLALTESICKLYNIKIGYEFVNDKHNFTLTKLKSLNKYE